MLRSVLIAAGAASAFARRALAPPRTGIDSLTPRQREILAAIARGRQSKEIARDLGVTESTVKTHLERAMRKLRARTRAEAVARYVAATMPKR